MDDIRGIRRVVVEEIIANCFRKAGVVYAEDDITESEVLEDAETENWKCLCEKLDVPTSVNLTDYVNMDCDVIVQKKKITDDEIVADIMSDGNPCDYEVEEEDVPQSD